ncbi:hypothetical protein LNTAR_03224 [Lentisphaera araneosa HTCC2155]|uniref:Uncharacterized protein n=1 Tax=Lentisphaera araneosa HTCC2155 TaxID=313628 RepID=A6DT32_9BACT|nr:hypothetical protein [Lentisphaera araneosa]EDM25207.1 hypothetical protein LNTAR_03224 [Lentisphaera araneosa HTCC2155]
MQRIIQVNSVCEQDAIRRASTKLMTREERVLALLEMQNRFLRWDTHPSMERVAKIKRLDFKDV